MQTTFRTIALLAGNDLYLDAGEKKDGIGDYDKKSTLKKSIGKNFE